LELTEDEWDEEKPEIEPGQFLWTRYRTDFDDGTLSHSTSICDTTLSGVLSVVNRAEQSIENKVW